MLFRNGLWFLLNLLKSWILIRAICKNIDAFNWSSYSLDYRMGLYHWSTCIFINWLWLSLTWFSFILGSRFFNSETFVLFFAWKLGNISYLFRWLICIYCYFPSTKLFSFLTRLSSSASCNRRIGCKTIFIIWAFFNNFISWQIWAKSISTLWFSLVHIFLRNLSIELLQKLLSSLFFLTNLKSCMHIRRVSKRSKRWKSTDLWACRWSASSLSRAWFPFCFDFWNSAASTFICSR